MSLQIDSSNPTLNLTVLPDLLALQLHKFDTGSGVDGVDIYQLTGMLRSHFHFYCSDYCFLPCSFTLTNVKSQFYTVLLVGANNSAICQMYNSSYLEQKRM